VRFPLRRNQVDDRLAILRLPPERGAAAEPARPIPAAAEPGAGLDGFEAGAQESQPRALLTALPVLTFANGRVTPGIVDSTSHLKIEPQAPAPPVANDATPALPFALPLKGQFTAADSRADRLVRQIRGEVDELRKSLDVLAIERDDMIEVDIQAVIANPEAAANLPPAVLVRTIIAASERTACLEAQLAHESKKASKLRRRVRALQLKGAARSSRLNTLEEVIAVLHGNLEDLRGDRDHEREIAAPAAPHAIRPASNDLPAPFPAFLERD
jgi:hypothetical protein